MTKEKILTYKYYLILVLLLLSLFVGLNYCKKFKVGQKEKSVITDVSKKNASPVQHTDAELSAQTKKEVDTNSDLAKSLHNMVSVFDNVKAGSYYGYFYSQDYIDFNTMSDDVKVLIGLTQTKYFKNDFVNSTYDVTSPDGNTFDMIIVSKEEVQEGIDNFFGPHTQFFDANLADAETDYCGFSRFKFDNTRNVYMSLPVTCSGFPRPHIDTKVTKVVEVGNTVEMTLSVAYIKYYNSKDNIIKQVYASNDGEYIEEHNLLTDNSYNINNILNRLHSYKFTFTLNGNNYYYFTKVEKIK